jgi:NADPH-dependent ferric siderophore reductase
MTTPDPARPWTARWRGIRRLDVLRTRQVTPAMRRVTFGGAEFAGLRGGPNLKLLLPPRHGMELELPGAAPDGKPLWAEAGRRAVVRTYTVSRLDEEAGELDIDFVLHGDEGVASAWAARARPGDQAGVAGLGGRTVRPAARHILAGDHTALPALANILAALPQEAQGHAYIEVPDAAEAVPLRHPPGVAVTWLHHGPHGAGRTDLLQRAVCSVPVAAEEDVFAWVGAESAAARTIRTHLRDACGLDRRKLLVIGYWKLGMSETEYGKRLDHDRDADYHAVAREEEHAQHTHQHGQHP